MQIRTYQQVIIHTHIRACKLPRAGTRPHSHIRTHGRTHARMHARMNACKHARSHTPHTKQTCALPRTHARVHVCTCARTHARMHTRTHAHTQARMQARRTHERAPARKQASTSAHTHARTQAHAQANTCTNTHRGKGHTCLLLLLHHSFAVPLFHYLARLSDPDGDSWRGPRRILARTTAAGLSGRSR